MKKSGIALHSIVSDAASACLAYELDKDSGHAERSVAVLDSVSGRRFSFSYVLVYRLGGSTYECSVVRTVGGRLQTVISSSGFENNGDAFTDLLTDIIADEFQKCVFIHCTFVTHASLRFTQEE